MIGVGVVYSEKSAEVPRARMRRTDVLKQRVSFTTRSSGSNDHDRLGIHGSQANQDRSDRIELDRIGAISERWQVRVEWHGLGMPNERVLTVIGNLIGTRENLIKLLSWSQPRIDDFDAST